MNATKTHPVLDGSAYQGYVYAYPHKTAYRTFAPKLLSDVWSTESTGGLFLYMHLPFCTMRCGFCNLFTTPNPKDNLVPLYLDALRRQAETVRTILPEARFARFAVGGGTPTFLDEPGLNELFDIATDVMGVKAIPIGIETSPDTITPEKIGLLQSRGVERVSIGVQSFIESETADSGRPQTRRQVDEALIMLANAAFPILNIDLIYGLPGQTLETWLYSLCAALEYSPGELYLYPLYVRPLTGLGRSRKVVDDFRLDMYRAGRDLLLENGYEQVSMRMFRKPSEVQACGPAYCCQEDGMIGLGCGARSYTRGLHYSLDYAVQPKGVKEIIADYLTRDPDDFSRAEHGFELDIDEQKRRYLLQSILQIEGLDSASYFSRFGNAPHDDFPDLRDFIDLGLLEYDRGRISPTALGLERSDALGPWFFSPRTRELTAEYEPR